MGTKPRDRVKLGIAPQRRTLGHEPAEPRAVARKEPVERVENGRESERTKQPAERPGEADLGEEHDASTPVACDWSAVPKHDPPTRAAPLFGNRREQAVGVRVR